MRARINTSYIPGMIAFRFIKHVVRYRLSINELILETDITYGTFFVISFYNRSKSLITSIGDILKQNVFDTPSRCITIFFIIEYTKIQQLPFSKILYTYILKTDIPYQIIIVCIKSHTVLRILLFSTRLRISIFT